jgi:hypothetical protein
MNKILLLKLARLLDRVPEEKFSMNDWAVSAQPVRKEPRCATAACALGWATTIPECKLELVASCFGSYGATVRRTDQHELEDTNAAILTFGITAAIAERLFMTGMLMTARQKAAEIRRVVRSAR